jgi:hypothetical protein
METNVVINIEAKIDQLSCLKKLILMPIFHKTGFNYLFLGKILVYFYN